MPAFRAPGGFFRHLRLCAFYFCKAPFNIGEAPAFVNEWITQKHNTARIKGQAPFQEKFLAILISRKQLILWNLEINNTINAEPINFTLKTAQ